MHPVLVGQSILAEQTERETKLWAFGYGQHTTAGGSKKMKRYGTGCYRMVQKQNRGHL